MAVSEGTERKRWQHSTSWDELGVTELPNGVRVSKYNIGDPDDENAPAVFRAFFPPGCVVAPHTHASDYTEIILEGSQEVTRRWYHAGDVRVVKAGTVYGPLVAGPEGVTVLVIFRDNRWEPIPVKDGGDEGLFVGELAARLGE